MLVLMLVWLTGTTGVGKSTICSLLAERGRHAIDADGLSHWVDRASGAIIGNPPARPPPRWAAEHAWCINEAAVEELADRSGGDVAVLGGSVENEQAVRHCFDGVICLVADNATIRRRLAGRSGNDFGKHPDELASILRWNRTSEARYRHLGATILDATSSAALLADQLELAITVSDDWTTPVRALVGSVGPGALGIDELGHDDLDDLTWSGGPLHVEHVRLALWRAERGGVEYLAVRSPLRRAISIGGIDYTSRPPTIWQLATQPRLQSLGLGSRLIEALEGRARARGHSQVQLQVEPSNTRAAALYQRLGYRSIGSATDGWAEQTETGQIYWHETEVTVMAKSLV